MPNLDYLTLDTLKNHLKIIKHPIIKKLNLLNSVKYYTKYLDVDPPATLDQFIAILDQVNLEPIQCKTCDLQYSFIDENCIFCSLGGDKKLIFDLHIHDNKLNPQGKNAFLLILLGNEYIKGPFLIKSFHDIMQTFNPVQLRNLAIDRVESVDPTPVRNHVASIKKIII